MSNTMPPVPFKSQMLDRNGYLSQAWSSFFRELFFRIGGSIAPSNAEIQNNTASITALNASVTSLSTRVTLLEGLDQGRHL